MHLRIASMRCVTIASLVVQCAFTRPIIAQEARPVVLRPDRVFDGFADQPHDGWIVVVRGDRIESAGPAGQVRVPADARVVELPGATLLPGLIDAHAHLLLHPYNEA